MRFKLTLAIIASFVAAPAVADGRRLPNKATPARGVYVGVFGGGGFGTSTNVNQLGTAFFTEAEGGPLAVNARGHTDSGGVGFIGGQIGYELSYRSFVQPAFELEGFYLEDRQPERDGGQPHGPARSSTRSTIASRSATPSTWRTWFSASRRCIRA